MEVSAILQEKKSNSSQLGFNSNNKFVILSRVIDNTSCYDLNNEDMLRKVIVKIRLEKINIQKEVTVEALLNNRTMRLVITFVICKSTCPENYIPTVIPPLNPTSPPSTAATFLATRLMTVLQPSGYSVFHGGDTPIQLSLP